MATHEYRIKCQACGLHYTVYSWDEGWAGGPEEGRQGGWCPECGIKGGKFVWTVSTEGQIFEKVPGIVGVEEIDGQKVGIAPPLMVTAGAKGSPFGYGKQTEETAGKAGIRGPYGTNEGDIWLAPDSDVQRLMDEKGEGHLLVHQVLDKNDGKGPQENLYVVEEDNPDPEMQDLISRAKQGHELWVAEQAARN